MIEVVKIRERYELAQEAAGWFHEKWGIPIEAYQESMEACIHGESAVPQWYLAVEKDTIVGGLGVIENDFHNRRDLTPNICSVYVKKECRCQGIAGKLLLFYDQYLFHAFAAVYEESKGKYLFLPERAF